MGCAQSLKYVSEKSHQNNQVENSHFRENLMWQQRKLSSLELRYQTNRLIGEGSMGSISMVTKLATNQKYASKKIMFNRVSKQMHKELQNEIAILNRLDHPNIIRCIETYQHKRNLCMILELCEGGDLYERKYTEAQAKVLIRKICSAVAYCHENNVCHRDLKLENILFETTDPDSEIKLIDFGLSKHYTRGQKMFRAVGTLYTMAPEVIKGFYTQACDCWSVGVIAYMLLSDNLPFSGETDEDMLAKIQKGYFYFTPTSTWDKISQDAKNFIAELLIKNPDKRATMKECLASKWLQNNSEPENHRRKDSAINQPILDSLRKFSGCGHLKRAAFMVIAYNMSHSQIKSLNQAFCQIDEANDGYITFEELAKVLIENNEENEDIQRIFKYIDQDGSGKIHYTEFLAATLQASNFIAEEKLAEAFDRMDSDDTGYISKQNLMALLGSDVSEDQVDKMILEGDLKKNGQIDYEEFLSLMKSTNN